MAKMRNASNILLENLKRERPVARHMHRWEDNVKMGL
jgi:hypothetical protein